LKKKFLEFFSALAGGTAIMAAVFFWGAWVSSWPVVHLDYLSPEGENPAVMVIIPDRDAPGGEKILEGQEAREWYSANQHTVGKDQIVWVRSRELAREWEEDVPTPEVWGSGYR